MTDKITVNVQAHHILFGRHGNAGHCAVNLAIREASESIGWVRVKEDIRFSDRFTRKRYTVATPKKVVDWLKRFDANVNVRPFKFELDLSEAFTEEMSISTPTLKPKKRKKYPPAPGANIPVKPVSANRRVWSQPDYIKDAKPAKAKAASVKAKATRRKPARKSKV